MRESRLEKYIKDYAYDKTGESVYLHLDDAVMISHVTRRGSITLAILWVNVLQHPANFPTDKYKYKKFYDNPTGGDRLIVKAEEINFTVFMASGTIVMEGKYIYDWFSKRFHELLDNYDESFQAGWTYLPTPSMPGATPTPEPVPYIPDTDTERYLMYRTTHHATGNSLHSKMDQLPDDMIPGIGNLNIDQTMYEGADLTREVETLRHGGLQHGMGVYKLWMSLLNKWFSQQHASVYVISPELDTDRMKDIVDLSMIHRNQGCLDTLYTNMDCGGSGGLSTEQVKVATLRQYDDKHRGHIDYRVLNKVMIPTVKVNAKLIAGVTGDMAEVMVTSAGFHGNSFLHNAMETVMVLTMSKQEFLSKFIDPISAPVVASMF